MKPQNQPLHLSKKNFDQDNAIPNLPGVYCMLDANQEVIYVGKAAHLKKRIQSYFNASKKSTKTEALVAQIEHINIHVTRSETEALILESQFIKKYRPKYNVLMRDDKSYPYLHIDLTHPFPRFSLARSKNNPRTKGYFGPYPSVLAIRETLNTIQKVFQLRTCRDNDFASRTRPCLQYQIGRCRAPCVDYITPEAYAVSVADAIKFLEGKSSALIKTLESRMESASQQMAFEEAAILRDQIKHLRYIQEQQGVAARAGDADIIVMKVDIGCVCIQWVAVRDGEITDSQTFFPDVPMHMLEPHDIQQAVFEAFIAHHYLEFPSRIPSCIISNQTIDHQFALEEALSLSRKKKCYIQTNVRGVKSRWVDFAVNNLERALTMHHSSKQLMVNRYQSLESILKLQTPVIQMVCFDISHTQGHETIASCVVFDRNGPLKSAYRKYNIKNITPGDDYAAMSQVLTRYLKGLQRDHKPWPTIILIDGGKGQVKKAKEVLKQLGDSSVTLLGIVKDTTRKAELDRLFFATTMEAVSLPANTPALHLLQHIRDEAHRFAITAHRKKRQKTLTSSVLEKIPGVGEKRRQALLRRFGGIREIKNASMEALTQVSGISRSLAQIIYDFLH